MGPLDVLGKCSTVFGKKRADYSPGADQWENFRFSSMFSSRVCSGLPIDDPRRSAAVLIGTKISRLMSLGLNREEQNEKVTDTIEDCINYLAILEAMQLEATETSKQLALPFAPVPPVDNSPEYGIAQHEEASYGHHRD